MPPPAPILCDLCGQKFFKRSLPIHRKQCEKKYQNCFTECKKCLRKVSNDEYEKHASECKVVRKKPMPKPKVEKERAIKPAKDHGDSSSEESSSEEEEDYREECGFCHRKFNPDRIAKHESICANNAEKKKRKQFKTSSQQRLEGTDFEKYMDPSSRRDVERLPSKWRQDHDRLQGIVEQGRLVKAFKDAGVPLTELPRPGTDLTQLLDGKEQANVDPAKAPVPEGMERCPHCTRTFASETAAKHIPKCKTTINKPKTLVRKSKPVLEKAKADHSEVIKSLVQKVLKMKNKKNDFFETKEASMFRVDEQVITSDGRKGKVRYIGRVSELFPGYWIGLELEEQKGNNDGSLERSTYFKCESGHGVFLRPSKIKKVPLLPSTEVKKPGDATTPSENNQAAKPQATKDTDKVTKTTEKEKQSSEEETQPKQKKEGLVERLRKEVRINSPRQQVSESSAPKPKKEGSKDDKSKAKKSKPQQQKPQRPEVDEPAVVKERKPTSSEKKKNAAEEARRKRIEKDAKLLEALSGKAPVPMQEPREESSFTQMTGKGQALGGNSSGASSATASSTTTKVARAEGPKANGNRPDREARAAYFEKMFAQKKQEAQ